MLNAGQCLLVHPAEGGEPKPTEKRRTAGIRDHEYRALTEARSWTQEQAALSPVEEGSARRRASCTLAVFILINLAIALAAIDCVRACPY